MALLNLGEDSWLWEYESCENLQRSIMGQLTERQQLARSSEKYSSLSANIRLRLKQCNTEVEQLGEKLGMVTNSSNLTTAEFERRTRLVEVLESKSKQMQKIFDNQVVSKHQEERARLVGRPQYSEQPGVSEEASFDQMQDNQRNMLREQDQGLESLSQIISRQKNIATTIATEVDFHNEILDDLGTQMVTTDTRVRDGTLRIQVVDRKDKTCIYWVIIVLLFLSIIIVAAIPS